MSHGTMSRRFHEDGSTPSEGQVFVFGSNLAGRHGAGAAKAALDQFGAQWGSGEGRQGQSYAIPTRDGRPGTPSMRSAAATLSPEAISQHIATFLDYARNHPNEQFFVTRVGCGLAGYRDEQIAPFFAQAPANCSLPAPWKRILEP